MLRRQFARYLLVGGLGTGVHLLFLVISVELAGLSATSGAIIGFISALLVSFLLNYKWTFKSCKPYISSFWRYFVVSISGLMLNTLMVNGLVKYFGLWYFTAQLSIIWVVPISNYLLNKYWSFEIQSLGYVKSLPRRL